MLQFAPGPVIGPPPASARGVQVRPNLSLAPEAPGPGGQKRSSSCVKEPPAGATRSQREA